MSPRDREIERLNAWIERGRPSTPPRTLRTALITFAWAAFVAGCFFLAVVDSISPETEIAVLRAFTEVVR